MTGHGERLIETGDDLAEGVEALCALCPRLAYAYTQTGPLPLRRRPDGFGELLRAIVGQQVSVASAGAIWSKLEGAELSTSGAVAAASEDALRTVGLSRQKIRYAQALAEAGLDYEALRYLPSQDVIKTLTAVPGIGPWTAEIYAMFSLGRADVFAPGDLAIQEAARLLYALDARPKERELRDLAKYWSPWRAVAARQLWAYYAVIKKRDGV